MVLYQGRKFEREGEIEDVQPTWRRAYLTQMDILNGEYRARGTAGEVVSFYSKTM